MLVPALFGIAGLISCTQVATGWERLPRPIKSAPQPNYSVNGSTVVAPSQFSCRFGGGTNGLLVVDPQSGAYNVSFPEHPGFPLRTGGKYCVLRAGRWLCNQDGLTLTKTETLSGADGVGRFVGLALTWELGPDRAMRRKPIGNTSWSWITSFKCYNDSKGPLTFGQLFPTGSTDIPGGVRDMNTPSTSFPSFETKGWPNSLQLATFYGQNAAQTTHSGPFNTTYVGRGGYLGGPLALFQPDLALVVVLSSLSRFMVTEHQLDTATRELRFGLQGLLHTIPEGFGAEFVLSPFAPGAPDRPPADQLMHAGTVAAAFMRWGDVLLNAHNGSRTPPDASPWISQLGYSTTGVFHYNPCDCPNNQNTSVCVKGNNPLMPGCHTYEDTLLQVHAYAENVGLPYRWFLIDSWWHAFDNNMYFEDTPAQVGQLFPKGLVWLANKTAMSFGAHWSSIFNKTSPYVALTGADDWACAGSSCVPRSPKIWEHIFGLGSRWGLHTIKVDHLYNAFVGHAGEAPMARQNASLTPSTTIVQALTDPFLAADFVGGIADGAAAHNVDVMWCMSYPNVLLQSVAHKGATHARGSSDSHPSSNNFIGFGGESTLEWALGLWPFKDTFYSNATERTLNQYCEDYGHKEDLPFTHAVAAALSGGGVAPGGVIDGADVALIRMTCRADGTLLKPTIPAMYLDAVWLDPARIGEASVARTVLGGLVWAFAYRIAITSTAAPGFTVTPSDVGLNVNPTLPAYLAYRFCGARPSQRCNNPGLLPTVQPFDSGHPFVFHDASTFREADVFVAVPVLPNGWAVLGEAAKLVPIAPQRISALESKGGSGVDASVSITLIGSPGEVVTMLFADPARQVYAFNCSVATTGMVTMTLTADGPAVACAA